MGKRHNTLNDTIFRNSKYIEVINKQVGCKDFKNFCQDEDNKDFKGQYDFMLDTFKTLILLNNCFYSDSNLSIADKVANALDIMEAYLYIDTDKKKYGVRFIQSIIEKHITYLYRRINEWYNILEPLTTKDITTTNWVKVVMEEIEKEMTRLEKIDFDNMIRDDIDYQKNKDSNYKIYISKFDTLYTNNEAFLEAYRNDFKELYGIDLTDDELSTMANFYILLAKANNGVVNVISNTEVKDYGLSEKSTPNDYYNAYLDTLHIKPKNRDKLEAQQFMLFFLLNYGQYLKPKGYTINDVINNYDSFHFLIVMEKYLKDDILKPSNDIANGLYKNLKCIYELMNKKVSNSDEVMKNYKKAYEEIAKVINRHIDYFIRLS